MELSNVEKLIEGFLSDLNLTSRQEKQKSDEEFFTNKKDVIKLTVMKILKKERLSFEKLMENCSVDQSHKELGIITKQHATSNHLTSQLKSEKNKKLELDEILALSHTQSKLKGNHLSEMALMIPKPD